ncbi:MAG: hypothetical protein II885_01495 [Oscillospiraceae bacterium]|nr:hypothetical protein [Oscillospiraceae bacterium]
MRKTILSLALVLAMLLSLGCTGLSAYADSSALTQKEMTFYICNVEDAQTWPVYFPADSDVPYISLRDWAVLMPYIVHTYVREGDVCTFELTYSMAGKTGALTREDGYFAEFDCVNDTILFEDYDAFLRGDSTKVLIDVLGADDPTPGQDAQFFRRTAGSYERYGDSVLLPRVIRHRAFDGRDRLLCPPADAQRLYALL